MKNLKKFSDLDEARVQNVDNGSVKKIRVTADDNSETVDVIKKEGYVTLVQNDPDGKRVAIYITNDMIEELQKVFADVLTNKF